jgi:hypothetical protein
LFPNLTFLQFSIGIETGQFCARSGAASGAVVGLARTQDKILAIDTGLFGGSKQFNVIDFLSVCAGDPGGAKRLPDGPGEMG